MYLRPASLSEACEAISSRPARILAGGTDVFPALVDRPAPAGILDISGLAELDGITQTDTEIRIGARTSWTRIASADLPAGLRALQAAAREVGSVQIQNVATIAGNLCNASPAADGVPPLLAVDAEVELASVAGTRRLPLDAFIEGNRRTALRPDEIMAAIIVPRASAAGASAFFKLGSRRYLVISIVMTAVRLVFDEGGRIRDARIAVGSCSAAAQRLRQLEADLVGRAPEEIAALVMPGHLAPLSPIDDVRASAAYRLEAARECVTRALAAALKAA